MGKKISTVFWDMDGTLVDSEALHAESSEYATKVIVEKYALSVSPIIVDPTGLSNETVFSLIFMSEIQELEPHVFREWEQLAVNYVMERITVDHAITQSLELFEYFYQRNIPQSIVSNSPGRLVEHTASVLNIKDKCRHLLSRDSVKNGKPDPSLYLNAIQLHGADFNECLAFEDSSSGITAARAARLNIIGVGELSAKYNPDHICFLTQNDWLTNLEEYYSF
jgi:sugar-phosphatase